jgi:hypothetical protein
MVLLNVFLVTPRDYWDYGKVILHHLASEKCLLEPLLSSSSHGQSYLPLPPFLSYVIPSPLLPQYHVYFET